MNTGATKDPRLIARGYQLRLSRKAVDENIIVYLGTGCGKTHIAVLLMYELGHLIRKPQGKVCVFLAPTIHLVQQQAMVIEDSTDFKIGCYFGKSKHLKKHSDWLEEIDEHEVLVMTPEILLHNLQHCFMRMELIALLIFDECHHAQSQNRHPYAQIMKEFYKPCMLNRPRIFGMTASIIGKGANNELNYSKSINSLESLLDSKVCTIEDNEELEILAASPNLEVHGYGPKGFSTYIHAYLKKLEEVKCKSLCLMKEKIKDANDLQRSVKLLWRLHENLLFCLENLGLLGAQEAVCILSSGGHTELSELMETDDHANEKSADLYLTHAASVLSSGITKDGIEQEPIRLGPLEEPFFSKKLLLLIQILSSYRPFEGMKCIVFVKRIIVARSLAFILQNLESLSNWKCEFLVGFHSRLKKMSRKKTNEIVVKFRNGELNLLIATSVAEEGLDIQTCCLVIRFDLPETVTSFIQSRGRARMQHSKYVFLVERGNENDLNLIEKFISNEESMNKEIISRSTAETFDDLIEERYIVDATGASISSGSSVKLLHHYCSKLPRDEYFTPKPVLFYIDDSKGTCCCIILPANAPIHEIKGPPCSSKDDAKRLACLRACSELHKLGCLTDYLLPRQEEGKEESSEKLTESDDSEDDSLGVDLHEMLIPAALRVPWSDSEKPVQLNFYYIKFIPIPNDRSYRAFGLFVKASLPTEAEDMDVDLHLAHGRKVNTKIIHFGMVEFDEDEILDAQLFQEMFLKVILDRDAFFHDIVPLTANDSSPMSSSTYYLLLPVKEDGDHERLTVDWETIRRSLSSPAFMVRDCVSTSNFLDEQSSLKLMNGSNNITDIRNSLVLTPHNSLLFFVDDVLYEMNGNSPFRNSTYLQHYREKFHIDLQFPHQPLLKAKQLFNLRNLLPNRLQVNRGIRAWPEHFVELPPEVCILKIIGFSKDIGSSLSLLPSMMHRLQNLLVAIELKQMLSSSFREGFEITANRVLEALTTEKCMERFSLERLEVLGDSFLKYAVSRHLFLCNENLDEGQLTSKRSSIIKNSNLYEVAVKRNLQVYIRDEWFDPCFFFALGRSCSVNCTEDTRHLIHIKHSSGNIENRDIDAVKCSRNHRWLHRKTVADVVEALVGAFIVDSGINAACAFLKWVGIAVDYKISNLSQDYSLYESMPTIEAIDVASLEKMLGYKFSCKGLLVQAFIHPSYNKHSVGCYQRLEFLGDAVLDYLITSDLYSVCPYLNPGQLTDLRSMAVNNNSFAHLAVRNSFHSYLIHDSNSLSMDIKKFVEACSGVKCLCKEQKCPKVLGDLVESCAAAVLLDCGLNLETTWNILCTFLNQIFSLSTSCLQLSSIRELQELCQTRDLRLSFTDSKKEKGAFSVEAHVEADGAPLIECRIANANRKVAKRLASQDVLMKLKSLGFEYKNNLLEKIAQIKFKKKGKLIGFDEMLTIPHAAGTLQPTILQNGEAHCSSRASASCSKEFVKASNEASINEKSTRSYKARELDLPSMMREWNSGEAAKKSMHHNSRVEIPGCKLSMKSFLYEFSNSNFRRQPSFICCKEEGPEHRKMFIYKVAVELQEKTPTILECFSKPMLTKKAAAENAAEGAVWCLLRLGYMHNMK